MQNTEKQTDRQQTDRNTQTSMHMLEHDTKLNNGVNCRSIHI